MPRRVDVASLRPDLGDEGAQDARDTLARWQANPRVWAIYCCNAAERRHNGRNPNFCVPAADWSYFLVMAAAEMEIAGQ